LAKSYLWWVGSKNCQL